MELMGKRRKINPGVSSSAHISPSNGRTSVSWRRGSRHAETERESVKEHLGAVMACLPHTGGTSLQSSPITHKAPGQQRGGWCVGAAVDVRERQSVEQKLTSLLPSE